jgi:hypothetical protein
MLNFYFRWILPQISKSETKICGGGNGNKTYYMKKTEKAISKQIDLKRKYLGNLVT